MRVCRRLSLIFQLAGRWSFLYDDKNFLQSGKVNHRFNLDIFKERARAIFHADDPTHGESLGENPAHTRGYQRISRGHMAGLEQVVKFADLG